MNSSSQEDIRDTKTRDKVGLGSQLDWKVKGQGGKGSRREAIMQCPRIPRHWF